MASELNSLDASRRKFLAQCGKFAIVTPPTISLMLATADQSFAVATSGGGAGGSNGGGGGTAAAGGAGALAFGGGGGGNGATFASAGGGGGASSFSPGAEVPPECAAIADETERAICIEEYAKGASPQPPPADTSLRTESFESAALPR